MTPERRLERVLAERQSDQQQLQEQLSSTLSSVLTNRMDKVLREEMKKTVPPSEHMHINNRPKQLYSDRADCERVVVDVCCQMRGVLLPFCYFGSNRRMVLSIINILLNLVRGASSPSSNKSVLFSVVALSRVLQKCVSE